MNKASRDCAYACLRISGVCMRLACYSLLLGVLLANLGCSARSRLTELRFTTSTPNKEDLVGAWIPDKSTQSDMAKRGRYNIERTTEIVLSEDGTFRSVNMPDWLETPYGDSGGAFYSDSGSWKTSRDGNLWLIELRSTAHFVRFNLVEQQSPHRLYVTLGDPDSRQAMVFIKK